MKIPSIPVVAGALFLILNASPLQAELPDRPSADREPLSAVEIQKRAFEIDKLIAEGFVSQGIRPVGDATEEQFVRRVYLDIMGRIPTYEEAVAYLNDESPEKNAVLIDRLLMSPGRVSHDFNYWADTLRATQRFAGSRADGTSYLLYIKRTMAENKPYDLWVREMLTASGGGWERNSTSGAVGYLERDKGMPLDNMANTMQVFLGTRMECAQCHDHPFNDEITQKDFFHTAAFTNGLKPVVDYKTVMGKKKFDSREDRDLKRLADQLRYDIYNFGVAGGGDGVIKLPKDYQYKDADPGETVGMKTPFGESVRNARAKPIDDSRAQFSEWLTSDSNPNFSKVIANRMWKRVMGYGVVEPIDNLDSDFTISNEKLMEHLAQMIRALDYDMVEFRRVLHNTKTYRQQPNTGEHSPGSPYYFQGRLLSRMTAEQIWDSILANIVPNLDARPGPHYTPAFKFGGRVVFAGKKDMHDIYEEVTSLGDGEFYGYVQKLMKEIDADLGESGGKKGKKSKASSEMSMMSDGASTEGAEMDARWSEYSSDLLRASELPSPSAANHFLRKFGQSARLVIDGATTESDVTQILSLINGEINNRIIGNSDSVLYENMEKAATPEEKIDVAYLSILTRRPSPEERELFIQNIEKNGKQGYDNAVWALFNSSEFMFEQ